MSATDTPQSPVLTDLCSTLSDAVTALDTYLASAKTMAGTALAPTGKPDRAAFNTYQHLAHGLAWLATYVETLREVSNWATRLEQAGKFDEIEQLLSQILFSKYLSDIVGGISMNQGEIVRPHELGLQSEIEALLKDASVNHLIMRGLTPAACAAAAVENTGLDDTMDMVRDQFRKFANDKVKPFAHEWHLRNEYIPMDVIEEMGELGVFGLTIPEAFGGFGMDKIAMCVVSEELSRGYIGVGHGSRPLPLAKFCRPLSSLNRIPVQTLARYAPGQKKPTTERITQSPAIRHGLHIPSVPI